MSFERYRTSEHLPKKLRGGAMHRHVALDGGGV